MRAVHDTPAARIRVAISCRTAARDRRVARLHS